MPESATPWEEIYREKTGQLADGAVLDMAVKYRGTSVGEDAAAQSLVQWTIDGQGRPGMFAPELEQVARLRLKLDLRRGEHLPRRGGVDGAQVRRRRTRSW